MNQSQPNTVKPARSLGGLAAALLATFLPASAWAVIAFDDVYVTDEDTQLTVNAGSGVLNNDDNEGALPMSVIAIDDAGTNGTVSLSSNGGFTYDPPADFVGVDTFSYTVIDGAFGTDTAAVTITVNSVNDAPVVIAPAPDVSASEDDPDLIIDLSAIIGDVDVATAGDTVTYSVSSITGDAVFTSTNVAGASLTLDYAADANGAATITVRGTDDASAFVEDTFTVTVAAVNDAPVVVAPVADVTVDEDAAPVSIDVSGVFTDTDIATNGDVLTYSVAGVAGDPVFDSTSVVGSSVDLVFTAEANGVATVTVRATDGGGAFVEDTFDVTVNAVNDAPYVAGAVPAGSFPEDTATGVVDLSGVFDDVDLTREGDNLTILVSGVADPAGVIAGAVMNGTDLELTFQPDQHGAGGVVTVTATDDQSESVSVDVDVEVTAVNDAPTVVAPIADVTVDEDAAGGSIDLSAVFADVDVATSGDSLTYTVAGVTGDPLGTAVIAGSSVVLSYAPDQNGTADVTVRATDTGGAFAEDTFTVTVNPINDSPFVASAPAPVTFPEDAGSASVSLAGVFDDVDLAIEGDNLSYSVVGGLPPFLSGAVMSGTDLDLTFAADQHGTGTVTVRATDDGGLFVEAGVDVTVNPVNDTPTVVGPLSDVAVDEDAADTVIGLVGVFDDVDLATSGDTLSYSVSGLSGDAVLDAASVAGTDLVLDYAADQHGVVDVTVRATDTFGAFAEDTIQVTVNPVNDVPTVANPIPDMTRAEDGPDVVVDLSTVFEDPDVLTNGDVLTLTETGNTNPALFDSVNLTGTTLTLDLAFDQNGTTVIQVTATDSMGASVSDSFELVISGVNDVPAPSDDAVTIDEDSGSVLIPVLVNDYLAETPTTITAAGAGGDSQSAPVIVLDPNGDPVLNGNGTTANGTVTIVGTDIEYLPKEHFHGVDYFDYVITDVNGDTGTARVTITVNPVNDPPTAPAQRNFSMLENGILTVDVTDGLLFGAYDVEGSSLSILPQTLPAVGVVSIDNTTGEFTYTPPVNFTGEVSFNYRVTDGASQSTDYEARIVVYATTPPPPPPPPGEVATPFNLSNVPLEQSTSVSPNVIIMMDDSGSMDWNMSVAGEDAQGGFVIDNDPIATSSVRSTTYYYLWDLPNNIFGTTSGNGRILPTQDEMVQWGYAANQYGLWRARNHKYNRLYYNPEVQYTPWVGQDDQNNEYANANPSAVRLNPRDPFNTFDILDDHDYFSDNIPRWRTGGGTGDRTVDNMYIPHYYATTANPPLAWNDPHTLVEIRPGNEPFTGGPAREDCASDDGDPMTCTYAQEIQNFANFFQYYRTREYAAKNGLGKVVSQLQDIRVGYETINDNRSEPVREMNDLHTEGNKKLLMDDIYRTNSSGGTPLRRALDRAGQIFSGNHGSDPLLAAPEGFCQQNFTLLFSDGYWNGSDPWWLGNEDADNSSSFDGGVYADTEDETLADVAMHYYERDIRAGYDDLVPVSQRDRLGAPDGTFPATGSPRMHQHMKTYTVAFGVVGDVDPTTLPVDPTVPFAWPDPEASPQGKIDDMLHAAVNGRGQFLSAVNPQELQTALEAAFLEFTQAASSTSAAAFNSTSLQEGTLLYRGFYDLRDFTGELSATLVNPDGTLNPVPEWRASEQLNPANKLPNNRVIISYDRNSRAGVPFRYGSLTADHQLVLNNDEVNYLRGQRGQEQPAGALRRRPTTDGLLGDIVNSSPVYVGDARGLHRDQAPYPETDLYSDFVDDQEGRQPMVYVGANDGILHGFDAMTGEELFGFVPNKVIDGTQTYHNDLDEFTSPFYQHKYFVDLSPRISDAYVRPSSTSIGRDWSTILLGGLGAGGKGYFALNVTDPAGSFTTEANASNVVLWEFTDEDDISPNPTLTDPLGAPVKDLGYALSLPSLAMSNVPDTDGNEWVAIFGNGPNSTAGVAKLFVLFMDRGLDGWGAGDFIKLDTGRGVPVAPDQLAGYPNGLGTPALVDTDLNGTVDWVYAGDRLGNLYRFDLCDRDTTTQECSTNPSDWTVTRLFTATYNDGGVERLQPILSQPLVIKHPDEDGFLVIFGTGSYITREDADDEEIQSIYAIWDRGETSPAMAQPNSKYDRLVEQTLTNIVDDSGTPVQTRRALTSNSVIYEPDDGGTMGTYGWYIDLDMPRATQTTSGAANPDSSGRNPPDAQFPGEKAIRRLVLRNGAIVTTTVLPSLDEFSCYGTRPGAILVLDAVTGGDIGRPVIDFNTDGVIDENDLLEDGGDTYSAGLLFNQGDLDGALVDLSTLGGEGDADWLFACGGNDCLPFRIEPPDESRTGRLSWRELSED
ncbi:MAG: hypothetical protein CMQ43_05195 [Gammaproteobacteria bacterium]|nr:hypothetical protein [Gammaproteobacteria bacterium]